jgi:hypothetical protein
MYFVVRSRYGDPAGGYPTCPSAVPGTPMASARDTRDAWAKAGCLERFDMGVGYSYNPRERE